MKVNLNLLRDSHAYSVGHHSAWWKEQYSRKAAEVLLFWAGIESGAKTRLFWSNSGLPYSVFPLQRAWFRKAAAHMSGAQRVKVLSGWKDTWSCERQRKARYKKNRRLSLNRREYKEASLGPRLFSNCHEAPAGKGKLAGVFGGAERFTNFRTNMDVRYKPMCDSHSVDDDMDSYYYLGARLGTVTRDMVASDWIHAHAHN